MQSSGCDFMTVKQKKTHVPLYAKLYLSLLEEIETSLSSGDRLDSEFAICRKHGVSRTTARLALQMLENGGYIYCVHGSGNFVSDYRDNGFGGDLTAIGQELISVPDNVKYRQLGFEQLGCDEVIARRIHAKPGTEMLCVERVCVGETPIYSEQAYLIEERFPDFSPEQLGNEQLVSVLTRDFDFHVTTCNNIIEPAISCPYSRELLELAPQQPVLVYERVLSERNRAVVYIRGFIRAMRLRYNSILHV